MYIFFHNAMSSGLGRTLTALKCSFHGLISNLKEVISILHLVILNTIIYIVIWRCILLHTWPIMLMLMLLSCIESLTWVVEVYNKPQRAVHRKICMTISYG